MQAKEITLTLLTPDADGIATSQTPLGAGNLTLDGAHTSDGAFSAATAHQISFTFAADETGRSFVVTGTDQDNKSVTETVAGAAPGTVETTIYFKTISSISVDAPTAGALTVGTVDEAVTNTLVLGNRGGSPDVGLAVILSGTINATVKHTLNNLAGVTGNVETLTWFSHGTLAGLTSSTDGSHSYPITAVRLVINSFTAGATAQFCVVTPHSS